MRRRLLASYLALTLVVLLLLEVPLAVGYGDRARDEVSTGLQRDAFVIANYAEETLEGDAHADLQRYVTDYQHRSGGRVLVVDAHGHVVADSASSGASSSDGPDAPSSARPSPATWSPDREGRPRSVTTPRTWSRR